MMTPVSRSTAGSTRCAWASMSGAWSGFTRAVSEISMYRTPFAAALRPIHSSLSSKSVLAAKSGFCWSAAICSSARTMSASGMRPRCSRGIRSPYGWPLVKT